MKNKVVVVLSAMAGETNKLQSYLDEFEAQNSIESEFAETCLVSAENLDSYRVCGRVPSIVVSPKSHESVVRTISLANELGLKISKESK